jgi:hypothetical protein
VKYPKRVFISVPDQDPAKSYGSFRIRNTEFGYWTENNLTCIWQLRISGEQAPSSTMRVTELLDQLIITECSSPFATG